jgi:hypothetical protein
VAATTHESKEDSEATVNEAASSSSSSSSSSASSASSSSSMAASNKTVGDVPSTEPADKVHVSVVTAEDHHLSLEWNEDLPEKQQDHLWKEHDLRFPSCHSCQ